MEEIIKLRREIIRSLRHVNDLETLKIILQLIMGIKGE